MVKDVTRNHFPALASVLSELDGVVSLIEQKVDSLDLGNAQANEEAQKMLAEAKQREAEISRRLALKEQELSAVKNASRAVAERLDSTIERLKQSAEG